MVSALCCCRLDGDFRECSWADAGIQDVKAWSVPVPVSLQAREGRRSAAGPSEGFAIPPLQDVWFLSHPWHTDMFCHLVCCVVAIPRLLILPALHFWGLLLQEPSSEDTDSKALAQSWRCFCRWGWAVKSMSRQGAAIAFSFSGCSTSLISASSPAGTAILPTPVQWEQPVC